MSSTFHICQTRCSCWRRNRSHRVCRRWAGPACRTPPRVLLQNHINRTPMMLAAVSNPVKHFNCLIIQSPSCWGRYLEDTCHSSVRWSRPVGHRSPRRSPSKSPAGAKAAATSGKALWPALRRCLQVLFCVGWRQSRQHLVVRLTDAVWDWVICSSTGSERPPAAETPVCSLLPPPAPPHLPSLHEYGWIFITQH